MIAEIHLTQQQVLALFAAQKTKLAGRPRQFLNDLQHAAGELRSSETYSERVAAEINFAAATLLLEAPSGAAIGRQP